MNSAFNKFFQKFMPYIHTILFAYIMATIIFLILPKKTIEHKEDTTSNLTYKTYDGFYSTNIVRKVQDNKKKALKNVENLSKYILKAIYSTNTNNGWIIVENKASKKSIILEKDEKMGDYTLIKLYKKYVIFEKGSKEYKLELPKEKEITYDIIKETNFGKQKITVKEDKVSIKRDYLNSYVKDLNKVWKDISIKQIYENSKTNGFKILKVNKKSIFSKLDLKVNDIIKTVNGQDIKSYADAFKIYNKIDKLKHLVLKVQRNNEIVELNYEIN